MHIICRTIVVPIIPAFLYELHHQKDMVVLNETLRLSSPSPAQVYNRKLDAKLSESANLLPYITSAKNRQQSPNRAEKCNREEVKHELFSLLFKLFCFLT